VLDEPTNDLDVETLDLLQELLADYEGTVLLVSHDRDFLDRTVNMTVALEGDGQATLYAGGWSDYQSQRKPQIDPLEPVEKKKIKATSQNIDKNDENTLSFVEQHRLKKLPDVIARLEAEIAKLETYLSEPDLYSTAPLKFEKATQALLERQSALSEAEEDWLMLEERSEG
jgi:ATP-binding cassette subfamily F protein uup